MRFPRRPEVLGLAIIALLTSGCAYITRASVDTAGGDPDNVSFSPSISADGRYVAFDSGASDLVPGDGNGFQDAFVRDLAKTTTTRVSVDAAGGDAAGPSLFPSISADGRYVAFESGANDVVLGDDNPGADVFVRDLLTEATTWVSVDAGGDSSGGGARPSISGDGRYVAFESSASLVPGDGNSLGDVFVQDLQSSTTTRVSVDTAGGDPNSDSFGPSISADGRYVAFVSFASDLVGGDGNATGDVFVRDLVTNTTSRVSIDSAGSDPNGVSGSPSINADGRYVAFQSEASDLVPADGTGGFEEQDVFVRDLLTDTTTRASVDTAGGDPNELSADASISGDGRYVVFSSLASDLVPGDGNLVTDVFVRDLVNDSTSRVSVDFLGREANGVSGGSPSISADGRYVAFVSFASDLVGGDGNSFPDIFVRAVVTPTVDSVTPATVARGTTPTLTLTGTGFFPGAEVSANAWGPGGVTVNSVTVVSETELNASVSVDSDAPTGERNVSVFNPGTGPGVLATGFGFCFGCLTVT